MARHSAALVALLAVAVLAASAAAANKPSATWTKNGYTYTQFTTPSNYTEAAASCREINSTLVTFANLQEVFDSVYDPAMLSSGQFSNFWSGLTIQMPPRMGFLRRPPTPKPPKSPRPPAKGKKASPGGRKLKAVDEGMGDAWVLENSVYTWDDRTTSASWVRSLMDHMTIRDCNNQKSLTTATTCCGMFFNVGPDAYGGSLPLIRFNPCNKKAGYVCERAVPKP